MTHSQPRLNMLPQSLAFLDIAWPQKPMADLKSSNLRHIPVIFDLVLVFALLSMHLVNTQV